MRKPLVGEVSGDGFGVASRVTSDPGDEQAGRVS